MPQTKPPLQPSIFPSLVNLRQRRKPQIRLDDPHAREDLLGVLGLDARMHNHIITGNPVDGRRDLVLVTRLQRVDDAQDFGGVAPRRGRVRQDGADRLLWVDDEDGADRESDALGVDVGCVLVVDPVLPLLVSCGLGTGYMEW